MLANARIWVTGAHTVSGGSVRKLFVRDFPAALYGVRWWGAITSLAVVILATISTIYLLNNPAALEVVGTAQERARIAEFEFENYYVEYSSASFSAQVWTNNGWLAVQCIVFGVTGFMPLMLMYNTVAQLGYAAAIMAEHGMLDIFFQLIAPHGLLELSAVFVAAGAGLKVFWTVFVPGARTRSQALAETGRSVLAAALAIVIALFISGLVEGYITGSSMPWTIKVVVGAILFAVFWIYIFAVGRWATQQGATGDIEGDFATAKVDVAG